MASEQPVNRHFRSSRAVPSGSLFDREFWAIDRHELVGGAADELLMPHAKEAIRDILEPLGLVGLVDIAAWADSVKYRDPNPATDDPETIAFLSDWRNKLNDTWHYVNMPFDADGYDRERYPTFTRDDDIVQITAESVRVLLGDSARFSVTNALRLVAHLVGDVHQPVHVGCCFLKGHGAVAKLTGDPDLAIQPGWAHDRGGNRIYLPIERGGVKLHAYWDTALQPNGADHDVGPFHDDAATATSDVEMDEQPSRDWFIRKLVRMIGEQSVQGAADAATVAAVPLDRLAEGWANASLIAARDAYYSLRIHGPHEGDGFDVTWEGQDAYDARCRPIVERRLAESSQDLAGLLNAIWS